MGVDILADFALESAVRVSIVRAETAAQPERIGERDCGNRRHVSENLQQGQKQIECGRLQSITGWALLY